MMWVIVCGQLIDGQVKIFLKHLFKAIHLKLNDI
jgi:hypothetical protein